MTLRLLLIALLPAVALATGCASARGAAPPWINGVSPQHPSERFLIGVGRGSTAELATERAYAAVARVFRAEVTAQSRDWESVLLSEGKGGRQTERRLSLDQLTHVSTSKVLENVALLDSWRDPASGEYHAMAGLSRSQAERALLERLQALDEAVTRHVRDAEAAEAPLDRIRALRRALRDGALREAYNADLRVVRTSGRGLAAPYQLAALGSELERLRAAHLLAAVEVDGEEADSVRQAIIEGLMREGVPVAGETTPAVTLLVKGGVQVWDAGLPDARFEFVRWCGDFQIVEPASGRVVGGVSKSGREGHVTKREARTKAVRVMQQELGRDLAKAVGDSLYGDAEAAEAAPPSACPTAVRRAP